MFSETKNNLNRKIISLILGLFIFFIGTAAVPLFQPIPSAKAADSISILEELKKDNTASNGTADFQFTARINKVPGGDKVCTYVHGVSACTPKWTFEWTDTINITPKLELNQPWIMYLEGVNAKNVDTFDVSVKATDQSGAVLNTKITVSLKTLVQHNQAIDESNGSGLNGILSFLNKILASLVLIVNYIIYYLFSLIIAPIIGAILRVNVHDAAFSAVILGGWVFLRNLMNVAFILIMLVIALGTLFRVKSINYKELLVKVVFMAILVNFSLVIARAILGIADTVQAQFLPANVDVIKNLAQQLMVAPALQAGTANISFSGSPLGGTVNILMNFLLAVFAFFIFLAIAAFLVVRIAMVWILLLTSPIAYAASILPQTKSYAKKWWSQFIRYAFFTPILALMLHLCAIIAVSQAEYIAMISNTAFVDKAYSGNVYTALSNVLVIACLVAALYIAEHSGVMGAHTITEWAVKKPIELGAHKAYEGVTAAKQRKTEGWAKGSFGQRMAFRALNPVTAWKGRQARIHEEHEEAADQALASATQASWKFARGLDTREDRLAHLATIDHKAKRYVNNDTEQSTDDILKMLERNDNIEDRTGLIQALTMNGRFGQVIKGLRLRMNARDANGNLTQEAKGLREQFEMHVPDSHKITSEDNRRLLNGFLHTKHDYASRVFLGEKFNQWAKEKGSLENIYTMVPDPNKPGDYINPDDYEDQVPDLLAKEQAGTLSKEETNLLDALRPKVGPGDKLWKWYKDDPHMVNPDGSPLGTGQKARVSSRQQYEKIDHLDAEAGEGRAKLRFKDDFLHYDENGRLTADSEALLQNYYRLELPNLLKMSNKSARDFAVGAHVDRKSSALVYESEADFNKMMSVFAGEQTGEGQYNLKKGSETLATVVRHLGTGHSGGDRRGATADGLIALVPSQRNAEGKVTKYKRVVIGGKNGLIHAGPAGDTIKDEQGRELVAGEEIDAADVAAVEFGNKVDIPTTEQEMIAKRRNTAGAPEPAAPEPASLLFDQYGRRPAGGANRTERNRPERDEAVATAEADIQHGDDDQE